MIKNSKEHLKNSNENYFEHLSMAIQISFQLFLAAFMLLIHAIIPSIFSTSASSKIRKLNTLIINRNNKYIIINNLLSH